MFDKQFICRKISNLNNVIFLRFIKRKIFEYLCISLQSLHFNITITFLM